MKLIPLSGLTLSELEEIISPHPRFHAAQIQKWIMRGAVDIDEMTDIPFQLRNELKKSNCILSGRITDCLEDRFAKKIVITLEDGQKIEAVLLEDGKNRFTACISTQSGCPIGCVFCKTGALKFKRNLETHEITEQIILLRSLAARKCEEEKKDHIIDNIVVMGMGEPLLNLANLRKAVEIITDSSAMNYSKRRITVSTCGICESLFDIANNGPYIRLALSLVTADENLRKKLMPAAKANPLGEIKKALLLYQEKSSSRITLEIPLLGGINTREKDTLCAAEFAKGMDCVVNIIPWNPVYGLEFEGKPLTEPSKKETENFISMLKKYGLKVTTRLRKGSGIMSACGQLGS